MSSIHGISREKKTPSDGCFFKKHPHLLQEKPCEQERHANTLCLHNKVARNLQFTPVDEPQTHWESAWMDAWKKLQTNQERRLAQKPKPSSKWHESDVFFFNGKLYRDDALPSNDNAQRILPALSGQLFLTSALCPPLRRQGSMHGGSRI